MRDNELPKIEVSFKKILQFANSNFIKHEIEENVGIFFPYLNITTLSYGEFTKTLLKKYNRTIEKQTCNTISHEIIHWWLFLELNIKTCAKFDNIAEKLTEYGVY